jgi:hypothetical protein
MYIMNSHPYEDGNGDKVFEPLEPFEHPNNCSTLYIHDDLNPLTPHGHIYNKHTYWSIMIEPCAICHESGGEQVYCIPECNHKYHTNCIMTWFRTGHDTCPLCNNQGINHGLNNTTWLNKLEALENYKHLRLYSRRKDAPEELKRSVKSLRRTEAKMQALRKKKKEFVTSKHPRLTARDILNKHTKLKREGWRIERLIRRKKLLIGLSKRTVNIIIPIKKNI